MVLFVVEWHGGGGDVVAGVPAERCGVAGWEVMERAMIVYGNWYIVYRISYIVLSRAIGDDEHGGDEGESGR